LRQRNDMPTRPNNPCRQPGCPNLTAHPRGYCPAHLPLQYAQEESTRLSPGERGYDTEWRHARAHFLARNPMCAECAREGRATVATVVDHIIPHHGDSKLFWDRANWQPLCKMHHDRKTAKEGGLAAHGKPEQKGEKNEARGD
jgi:5-methylcytosine-specific restriction protein A